MLSLLTRTKSFEDPWVGHLQWNQRWGLHRRRVQLAEQLCRWRRRLRPGSCADLARDGYVVMEIFCRRRPSPRCRRRWKNGCSS